MEAQCSANTFYKFNTDRDSMIILYDLYRLAKSYQIKNTQVQQCLAHILLDAFNPMTLRKNGQNSMSFGSSECNRAKYNFEWRKNCSFYCIFLLLTAFKYNDCIIISSNECLLITCMSFC